MSEQADIHARLMSKYPQVPEWGYASIFGEVHAFSQEECILTVNLAIMFVFGVVCIEVWHTEMPVWAFILALVRTPHLHIF